jgi:M6 family metalloprotease-like protein
MPPRKLDQDIKQTKTVHLISTTSKVMRGARIRSLCTAGMTLCLVILLMSTLGTVPMGGVTNTQPADESSPVRAHLPRTAMVFPSSIPAYPGLLTVAQADGTEFKARLFGDESYHWMETADGWSFTWNSKANRYEYVRVDRNGRFSLTGLVVGSDDPTASGLRKHARESKKVIKEKIGEWCGKLGHRVTFSDRDETDLNSAITVLPRSKKTGTQPMLLVLAKFTDLNATHTRDEFDRMMNTKGYSDNGAKGSVRDYYEEASGGKLNLVTTVTDWVTVTGASNSYGTDTLSWQRFGREAISALDQAGFDFSSMDADHNGMVDYIGFVHPGKGQEGTGISTNIWSHMAYFRDPIVVDGVIIFKYMMVPELFADGGMTRIGTYCHETGHMLGIDDLVGGSDAGGIGYWSVMGVGGWCDDALSPSHFTAYEKCAFGWIEPTVINESQEGLTLEPVEDGGGVYKITSGYLNKSGIYEGEYLLLENRQKSGFDAAIPGHGLEILHVDESAFNDTDINRRIAKILQADGRNDLNNGSNYGDEGDLFPGSADKTMIGPLTTPATKSYFLGKSGVTISNISEAGDTISFDVSIKKPPQVSNNWPGPDRFGYRGSVSKGGFEDISQTGSAMSNADEGGIIQIGFPFKAYGGQYSQIYVHREGWMSLSVDLNFDAYGSSRWIPSAWGPGLTIAPCWFRAYPDENLQVYYEVKGSQPNRYLVVQWTGIIYIAPEVGYFVIHGPISFQAMLYEKDGNIDFCYRSINKTSMNGYAYLLYTVGIQDRSGKNGVRYAFMKERDLANGMKISFSVVKGVDLKAEITGTKRQTAEANPPAIYKTAVGRAEVVTAEISNIGTQTVKRLNVVFYEDGTAIAEKTIRKLASAKSTTVEFIYTPTKRGKHILKVTVDPEEKTSDFDRGNNSSEVKTLCR